MQEKRTPAAEYKTTGQYYNINFISINVEGSHDPFPFSSYSFYSHPSLPLYRGGIYTFRIHNRPHPLYIFFDPDYAIDKYYVPAITT